MPPPPHRLFHFMSCLTSSFLLHALPWPHHVGIWKVTEVCCPCCKLSTSGEVREHSHTLKYELTHLGQKVSLTVMVLPEFLTVWHAKWKQWLLVMVPRLFYLFICGHDVC